VKDEQIEHWKKIVKTQEELKDLLNKVRFCPVMMLRTGSFHCVFPKKTQTTTQNSCYYTVLKKASCSKACQESLL